MNFVILVYFSLGGISIACDKELKLPKPSGPYSVGTKAIEIRDSSRKMLRGNGIRRWMVQAFYPSQLHEGNYPYMPRTLKDGEVGGIKVLAHSKPNAVPLLSKRFPLILAIPGRGGERQKETILYEELASHGYVILAMDQPCVANFVRFSNGEKIVLTFKDVWKVPRDRDYRYAYDDEVIAGAIGDIQYLLAHPEDLGEIRKIFHKDYVILMGHSLGGNVAL